MSLTMHVEVGGLAATITSQSHDPVEWVSSYFGPWWPPIPGPASAGPTIEAIVDADCYHELERLARTDHHSEVLYARAPTLLVKATDGGQVAVTPSQHVAYHRDANGDCTVTGTQVEPVSMALARIARESVRARLQASGWALVHSSVIVNHNADAVLAFGSKGSGKTTVGLALATGSGWRLLANDRAFARATTSGQIELLPWPAAAALGLGLLDAYGLTPTVRDRLAAGDTLHPTSDPKVRTAILTGDRSGLRDASDRERKAQFYPEQLEDWLGMRLACSGAAKAVLHPQIDLDQAPAQLPTERQVSEDDFFHGATEDRYPDILSIHTASRPSGWPAAREHFAQLPQATVRLGGAATANRRLLSTVVDHLLADEG